jgi:glycine/D-amino acid oxidase-like deaminating enzyme
MMSEGTMRSETLPLTWEVPVAARTQVLVIGGGPAGIGAAIGAARGGATTTLVEQYGFLGGAATAAMVGPFMTSFARDGENQIIGGVFDELVRRMEALGGAIHPAKVRAGSPEAGFYLFGHDHVTPFDSEALKVVAAEMALENGVDLWLHTRFIQPLVDEGRVVGAVVHNKSGLQAIMAQVVIDCTGDADVAHAAGAPTVKGRAGDHLMQPMTMFFRVGDVDDDAVAAYVAEHPAERSHLFQSIIAEAGEDFPAPREHIGVYRTPEPGIWRVNTTRLSGLDGTDAADLTQGEILGRKQVWALMDFFRERLPGFQDAILLDTAPQVGVRETRHIVGEYTLTGEDLSGVHFDDVIALGSFPVDIHPVTGTGGSIEAYFDQGLETAPAYEIPYRSLVPQGMEGLLVAGRSISATHEASGAVRVMPPCYAMGQAAGVAASLAVAQGLPVRDVPIPALQEALRGQGAILSV